MRSPVFLVVPGLPCGVRGGGAAVFGGWWCPHGCRGRKRASVVLLRICLVSLLSPHLLPALSRGSLPRGIFFPEY